MRKIENAPYKIWAQTTLTNQAQSNPEHAFDLIELKMKIERGLELDSSGLSLLKSAIETEKLSMNSGALDDLLLYVDELLISEMRFAHDDVQAAIKKLVAEQVHTHRCSQRDGSGEGTITFEGFLIPFKDMNEITDLLYSARAKLEGA